MNDGGFRRSASGGGQCAFGGSRERKFRAFRGGFGSFRIRRQPRDQPARGADWNPIASSLDALHDADRRRPAVPGGSRTTLEDAAGNAAGAAGTVRGRLRVDIDPFFAQILLARRFGEFLGRHAELSLDLTTREHVGDLIADGIDVGLRFGEPSGSSAIARKLLETKIMTVASPDLIKRHGRPKHPKDLADFPCIHFRDPVSGRPFEWEFHRRREIVKVATESRLLLGDVGTMLNACLGGAGVAQVMALSIRDEVKRGKLIDLFPDWSDERFPLYALYPSRMQPSARVRAFLDFVMQAVA